jgi:hypothetical protein
VSKRIPFAGYSNVWINAGSPGDWISGVPGYRISIEGISLVLAVPSALSGPLQFTLSGFDCPVTTTPGYSYPGALSWSLTPSVGTTIALEEKFNGAVSFHTDKWELGQPTNAVQALISLNADTDSLGSSSVLNFWGYLEKIR